MSGNNVNQKIQYDIGRARMHKEEFLRALKNTRAGTTLQIESDDNSSAFAVSLVLDEESAKMIRDVFSSQVMHWNSALFELGIAEDPTKNEEGW